jgi:hypothetical protein
MPGSKLWRLAFSLAGRSRLLLQARPIDLQLPVKVKEWKYR